MMFTYVTLIPNSTLTLNLPVKIKEKLKSEYVSLEPESFAPIRNQLPRTVIFHFFTKRSNQCLALNSEDQ